VAAAALLITAHGAELSRTIRSAGWGALWCIVASIVVFAADTWGWRLAFPGERPKVSFMRLYNVRMAGEAVSKVTPLASMGGEPLKGYLLSSRGSVSTAVALASVVISKNTMTLAQIAFIFAGVALAANLHPQIASLVSTAAIFPGVVLTAMIVTAVLDHRLRRGRKAVPPPASPPDPATELPILEEAVRDNGASPSAANGLRGSVSRYLRRGLSEIWVQVADFFWERPIAFLGSWLLFLVGWAAGALELWAAAAVLGHPLSVWDALAMEALLCGVNMATFFIPDNAGSQEGGFTVLAPMFGLDPAQGLSMAVLRRIRDIFWILYGLVYLFLTEGELIPIRRPTT
jgi:hypothetical protein